MKKDISYAIGNIGVVVFIITTLSVAGKLLFFGGNLEKIPIISYVVAGIGFCLAACPVIFGHVPRKKTGNLDFPYYPPRY